MNKVLETESKSKRSFIPANYIAGQAILRSREEIDVELKSTALPIPQGLQFRTQNPFSGINIQKWNEPIISSHTVYITSSGVASQWYFLMPYQLKPIKEICEEVYDENYLKMILQEETRALGVYQEVEECFEILLVVKYKDISEVKAIYIDEYLDDKNITILLSIKQYNDKLMESLIQKEIDISNVFPNIIANYNYIPDLIDDKKSIIGEKTKLIFER